jgi:hypothetical protein
MMEGKTKQIRMPILQNVFVSLLLLGVFNPAFAEEFDFLTQTLTVGPRFISIETSGVTATVAAYHVEFDGGTSTIFGPFTTGDIQGRQVFGTNTSGIGNPGLGLTTVEDLGQTDPDVFSAVIQPGFDNFGDSPYVPPDVFPSVQFALFRFDSPVDVVQVIVDDVSNYDRDIWAAGGNSAPDLSLDLVSAFGDFTVVNSSDDASDGPFIHTFSTLQNITFLAVGTALPSTVGDLGPFAQGQPSGGSQFYINALNFVKLEKPKIPIPGVIELLLLTSSN